ncbi:phosphoglycerate mutase [Bifidobacterium minimum]|uniref:Phosphoglycerate mutase n=1 Tax=Bifidobacterium minimum TaxID=1693 RepID=A0A087BNF3_9BIFI|nr:histidine phosphatase family protein [Bifidobacterium minimum]KFI72553.1 phosphoglycerate mutase [Bifidobacterium minimum]
MSEGSVVEDASRDVPVEGSLVAPVRSLILVRHGRTSYNAGNRLQGQIDIPLDEVGRWQAGRTAEALDRLYVEGHDVRPPVVVSSDLGRALSTAHAFADVVGVDVHPDPRVRERDFGEWEGIPVDELRRDFPEDYRLWTQFRGGEMRHGAEPKTHVGLRGVEALRDASRDMAGDRDRDLIVFSHGAWIAQTVQTLLGIERIDPGLGTLPSIRNAHWARLVPLVVPDAPVRWRLVDYNHGPVEADSGSWEDPFRR